MTVNLIQVVQSNIRCLKYLWVQRHAGSPDSDRDPAPGTNRSLTWGFCYFLNMAAVYILHSKSAPEFYTGNSKDPQNQTHFRAA